MFLIGLHVLVTIVIWILWVIFNKKDRWSDLAEIFLGIAVILSFITFCHGVVIGISNANIEQEVLKWQTKRDAIVYEMNEGILIGDALTDFNTDLATEKWANDNPWLNWYVNDSVDEVELIPID